jgi:rod shape-determining protein MreB
MRNFNFFRSKSFALDLGNNNTLVSDDQFILVDQPSYIVFNSANQRAVKAVGTDAFEMFEKSPEDLYPVKPLKGGVIADYESASLMIGEMVKRASLKRAFYEGFDQIISGVPFYTTDVERRALMNALEQFHARRTHLLYEPLAAALGMGLNIREPEGKMIVDIGGGITEIVVISLSGIASFESIKVSGDSMDSDIRDHFRRRYNMAIGLRSAEVVKINVGAVSEKPIDPPPAWIVKGKNLVNGIPVTRTIDHTEVSQILDKSITAIEESVVHTLERCPPELAADIYQNGIHITGGNALLRGLKERFEHRIKVPVHIDPTPLHSVTNGIAEALRNTQHYRGILIGS